MYSLLLWKDRASVVQRYKNKARRGFQDRVNGDSWKGWIEHINLVVRPHCSAGVYQSQLSVSRSDSYLELFVVLYSNTIFTGVPRVHPCRSHSQISLFSANTTLFLNCTPCWYWTQTTIQKVICIHKTGTFWQTDTSWLGQGSNGGVDRKFRTLRW